MNKIFIYLVILILFLFSLSIGVAPLNKLNDFDKIVKSDSVFLSKWDTTYNHAVLNDIIKHRTYYDALLKMAVSDSIQLAINLTDSTVCLFIKGVKIHQTKISYFEQDKLLNKLSNMQYVKLFGQPLSIDQQRATIVKEPIVIRQAPKDTAEAALTAWKPDTLIQNPAFVQFKLNAGLTIFCEQDKNEKFSDNWTRTKFSTSILAEKIYKSISNFVCFRKQNYEPTIKIALPINDLRTIYRALPQNAMVVIYLQ